MPSRSFWSRLTWTWNRPGEYSRILTQAQSGKRPNHVGNPRLAMEVHSMAAQSSEESRFCFANAAMRCGPAHTLARTAVFSCDVDRSPAGQPWLWPSTFSSLGFA